MEGLSGKNRNKWLSKHLGESLNHYDERNYLRLRLVWSKPIIKLIDDKIISLATGQALAKHTQLLSRKHKVPPTKMVKHVLGSFESVEGVAKDIPTIKWEGKVVRGTPTKRSGPSKKKLLNRHSDYSPVLGREFRQDLSNRAAKYIEDLSATKHITEHQRKPLLHELQEGLKQVVDDITLSIARVRRDAKAEILGQLDEDEFRWACEVLELKIEFGKAITNKAEVIKQINRAARRRARDLHPDNNQSEAAREEYERVQRARETLLDYVRHIDTRGTNGN